MFEAEESSAPSDYVALLETLAAEHRDLYDEGLFWFLCSRVSYYLSIGELGRVQNVVDQDAAAMMETGEAYFGIVSKLRLAGLEDPADTLAIAGVRVMNVSQLLPWAVEEVFHFFVDSHVRQCVRDGGDDLAIERMESILQKSDASMDADVVLLRAEVIRRLTGKTTTKWMRNQLTGTNNHAGKNRYLLSFEFSHWLTDQQGIAPIAADELRKLVLESVAREHLTMRYYFDGIPHSALDKHLVSLLGFMSLDRFKAPASLIAVEHFVRFLDQVGLVKPNSLARSLETIQAIDAQLRRLLSSEWSSFTFLDPLRPSPSNITDTAQEK